MSNRLNLKEDIIHPHETLIPYSINSTQRNGYSIAGSVGKKISNRKPGINEDAGAIIRLNDHLIFSILIDGHFERDTTEILLNEFSSNINRLSEFKSFHDFVTFANQIQESALRQMNNENAIGEASFLINCINIQENKLYYFLVGDVMMFVQDERRIWGKHFQISNRHYYEWINKKGLMGYHVGEFLLSKSLKLLFTTDGLIDEPIITHLAIEKLFNNGGLGNIAENLVKYALDNNEDDDNITVIFFDLTQIL